MIISLYHIWVNFKNSLTWFFRLKGDDSPIFTHIPRIRANSEVVRKFTQINHHQCFFLTIIIVHSDDWSHLWKWFTLSHVSHNIEWHYSPIDWSIADGSIVYQMVIGPLYPMFHTSSPFVIRRFWACSSEAVTSKSSILKAATTWWNASRLPHMGLHSDIQWSFILIDS